MGDSVRLDTATRLQRSRWRPIWYNPRVRDSQFQPSAEGMRATLPYLDGLLPVHNLESLEEFSRLLQTDFGPRPVRRQFPAPATIAAGGHA